MKIKNLWKQSLCLLCACSLFSAPYTAVFAAETQSPQATETSVPETTEEPERLEPDAYFEPIQTNEVEGWPQGPAVWAESAVVMDLDSGAFLYSKNMDTVKYPASITKIMTTLLAIENSRPYERVTFSEHAIYGIERNSSHIGIRPGEILSMEECWYGMMLESANEVCLAVAEHIGGSVENFVNLMNQKAAELGCTNTHFTNPNGLPDENHYTSAHDMALISRAAYQNSTFRKVIQTTIYKIPKTNMCGEERWLNNHHKMLPDGAYFYEGCTGGKTGFTQAALNTLVTFAERNGRRLACVMLRTNGPQIYADTAALLDYGFANFTNLPVFQRNVCPGSHMLYPSLYSGFPSALDAKRLSCQISLPVTAVGENADPTVILQEQVQQTTALSDQNICRTYTYHQYPVGAETIPTDTIRTLMKGSAEETVSPSALPSELTETPDSEETAPPTAEQSSPENRPDDETNFLLSLLHTMAAVPFYIYLLVGLLIFLIILEISLYKRKKRRRRKHKQKK